jgi:hypothetical protein
MNKLVEYLKNPIKIKKGLLFRMAPYIEDDATFLKIKWKICMDYPLNLDNPKTYNEKLQWLKLHDRKPEYMTMVDKYEAKLYVSKIIGEDYIIPTIAVYNNVEAIDFESLPDQFVLKCTHDSGGVVICEDKANLDIDSVITKLRKRYNNNWFLFYREWPYKNLKHRIIAEQYITTQNNDLKDYKFYCFDGVVKAIMVAEGRFSEKKSFSYFDTNWNKLDFTWGAPKPTVYPTKPEHFSEMLEIAEELSKGIPHVRVDLYNVDGKIYFGELTFYDGSGMQAFEPRQWDYKFGEYINLEKLR